MFLSGNRVEENSDLSWRAVQILRTDIVEVNSFLHVTALYAAVSLHKTVCSKQE